MTALMKYMAVLVVAGALSLAATGSFAQSQPEFGLPCLLRSLPLLTTLALVDTDESRGLHRGERKLPVLILSLFWRRFKCYLHLALHRDYFQWLPLTSSRMLGMGRGSIHCRFG